MIICEIHSGRKAFEIDSGQPTANIEFIAHARQDISALLDALEESEATTDNIRAARDCFRNERDYWKAKAEALSNRVREIFYYRSKYW